MARTLTLALPSDDDDAVDSDFAAQVHHPDGVLDEVVVQDGASMKDGIRVPVNGQTGASVLPVLPQMALVVEPRVPMESQVLHCHDTKKQNGVRMTGRVSYFTMGTYGIRKRDGCGRIRDRIRPDAGNRAGPLAGRCRCATFVDESERNEP